MDTSGSTGGTILNAQKEMAKTLFHRDATTIVSWNDSARIVSEQQFGMMNARGGTSPSSLFYHGNNVVSSIHNSPFIVFSTDGDVGASEVAQFSSQCTDHFHHASLILCVLCTATRYTAPSQIDVSVFAPLLTFPNVMLVHLGGYTNDLRIMAVSDGIRNKLDKLLPVELDLSSFLTPPEITLTDILNIRVDAPRTFVPVRSGYRLLSNGRGFNVDALLTTDSDTAVPLSVSHTDIWNELVEQMRSVVLLCKNEARLDQLREWVVHQRYLLHQSLRTVKASLLPLHQSPQMDVLRGQIEEIMDWLFQNQSVVESDSVTAYRVQLQVARADLNKLMVEQNNHLNNDPSVVRINESLKDTDRFLSTLQSTESSSYRSGDVLRGLGNRAMRANEVAPMDDDLDSKLESIVWEDSVSSVATPKMECRICCDVEHVCIILRYNPDAESDAYQEALEINGRDYVMNCPLAFGRVNMRFLSSQVYCKNCSLYLWEHGKLDTFRSKISAIMPVAPWSSKSNRAFFRQALANSLGGGRDLPHLFLLYYALLDCAESKEWSNEYKPLLTYTFDQMMDHVRCTDNFTETGRKCSLREAFHHLLGMPKIQSSVELMRQPIESVFVIARHGLINVLNKVTPMNDKERKELMDCVHLVFVERYMRLLMERYCTYVKPNGTAEENLVKNTTIVRQLLDALYECTGLGVPKHGSGRIVRDINVHSGTVFRHPVLETLIPSSYKAVIDQNWTRLWELFKPASIPDLVPPVSLTQLLFAMVGLEYRPLEDMWKNCRFISTSFFAHVLRVREDVIIHKLNQSMFKTLPKDMKDVDPVGLHDQLSHQCLPPYVSHLGTSVLNCLCGYSFLDTTQPFESVKQLIESVKDARAHHFEQVYGSEYPSECSYHVSMYKIVISVVQQTYPWMERTSAQVVCSNQQLRAMVVEVLYRLNKVGLGGTKGNIFRSDLVSKVACVLIDYMRVWQALPIPTGQVEVDRTMLRQLRSWDFEDKIKAELHVQELTLPLSGEVLERARQCATRPLRADSVDAELSAPLTTEEMMRVLPMEQVKQALKVW